MDQFHLKTGARRVRGPLSKVKFIGVQDCFSSIFLLKLHVGSVLLPSAFANIITSAFCKPYLQTILALRNESAVSSQIIRTRYARVENHFLGDTSLFLAT